MPDEFVNVYVRLKSRRDGEWLVPPELRDRLMADAVDSNLTDVVVRIVSGVYGVPYVANGRRGLLSADATSLFFRLPVKLYETLERARLRTRPRRSVQQLIVETLCAHYGLTLPARRRRGGRRRTAAAA